MLTESSRLRIREPMVAAKVIDGAAVIINLETGMYYSMEDTGGFIWSLVERRCSLRECAAGLSSFFAVDAQTATADVLRLWEQLIAEGLVEFVESERAADDYWAGSSEVPRPYKPPVLSKFADMADLFAADPPLPQLPPVDSRKFN